MKKVFLILMAIMLTGIAFAQPRLPYHSIQIVDERGVTVTTITSVAIYAPDSTTDAVIYSDRGLNNVMVIPILEDSDNTTLIDGVLSWYGPDQYNFSITDGTNIATNANHRARSSSEGTLVFPSYITAISSTTYADGSSATWGSSPAFTQSISGGTMTFTPGSDNVNFVIGVSGTGLNSDFNVYVGADLGLEIDAGDGTFIWDGGAVLLNHDHNANVGINTGTSTGATTIGSSTSGTLALETTAGFTILADDASTIKTSAGTLLVESTGGDLTIDATDASVKIDGGEAAVDAVTIVSAGGMDISLVDDFDLALVSGATDENMSFILSGATASSIIWTSSGTGADAMDFNTSAGGIDIDMTGTDAGEDFSITTATSITFVTTEAVANQFYTDAQGTVSGYAIVLETTEGGIQLLSDGDTEGDIDIDCEDDMTTTSGDDMTITVGGDLVFAVTGDTTLPADMLLKATTALTHDHMDNLTATPKIVVAAVPGKTIEFVSAILALDWDSVAWTENSAPDDLVIRYEDGTGAIVSQLLDATGFATATEDTVIFLGPNVANAAGAAVASVAVTEANSTNKDLVLDNTGEEWTGSGDSQVVVIVYYRLHTTAELGLD